MKSNVGNEFCTWLVYTTVPLGTVTLLLLLCFSSKLTYFTATCYLRDLHCERSWGRTSMFEEVIGSMVLQNAGSDVLLVPSGLPVGNSKKVTTVAKAH